VLEEGRRRASARCPPRLTIEFLWLAAIAVCPSVCLSVHVWNGEEQACFPAGGCSRGHCQCSLLYAAGIRFVMKSNNNTSLRLRTCKHAPWHSFIIGRLPRADHS
jgi:hypothetical protein